MLTESEFRQRLGLWSADRARLEGIAFWVSQRKRIGDEAVLAAIDANRNTGRTTNIAIRAVLRLFNRDVPGVACAGRGHQSADPIMQRVLQFAAALELDAKQIRAATPADSNEIFLHGNTPDSFALAVDHDQD